MRRVKVVVSDFHMGFGRTSAAGALNDLEDFVSDQAFVDLLEYYRTGEYVDAEVELVLNGDIFEGLTTVDTSDPDPDMITVAKSLAKIEHIVEGHAEAFRALAVFARAENRNVTFTVGNHDQDLLWEEVQQRLRQLIDSSVRFINGPYVFDGVHLEHGHQYERNNRFEKRLFISRGLPEPVLNLPWGSDMFINCLLRFKRLRPYVNRVRPFRLAVIWSLVHDFRAIMRFVWYFIAAMVRARFRRNRERRITLLRSLRTMFSVKSYPTLEDAARKILASADIHTVVFGHTHIPMWRQLLPGKSYLNSGTWIPTSNVHISQLGLSLLQTYVYVEYDNGRPQARLKVWHGRHVVEEDIVV